MDEIKYFICERKGGCRLSDLNFDLLEGQKFERNIQIIEGSKSIKAAVKIGWIKEITKKEFYKTGDKK